MSGFKQRDLAVVVIIGHVLAQFKLFPPDKYMITMNRPDLLLLPHQHFIFSYHMHIGGSWSPASASQCPQSVYPTTPSQSQHAWQSVVSHFSQITQSRSRAAAPTLSPPLTDIVVLLLRTITLSLQFSMLSLDVDSTCSIWFTGTSESVSQSQGD